MDLEKILSCIRQRKTHNNIMRSGIGVGGYCLTKDPLFAEASAKQVLGKPMTEVEKTERWNIISKVKAFWENLKWMPGAKRIYDLMSKYNLNILSAYTSRDPNCRR